MRPLSFLSVLLGLLASAGCGRYYDIGNPDGARGEFAYLSTAHGLPVIVCPSCTRRPAEAQPVTYHVHASPAEAPPPRRKVVVETVVVRSFDPHAARAALTAIDVSGCRDAGAPPGFGHARVTLNPDGRISKVVVDAPAGMTEAAADCIGHQLGAATVPPFQGSLVTMGTTYHVAAP